MEFKTENVEFMRTNAEINNKILMILRVKKRNRTTKKWIETAKILKGVREDVVV